MSQLDLRQLLDADRLSVAAVARAVQGIEPWSQGDWTWEALMGVWTSLPLRLVEAEAIWMMDATPADGEPSAERASWYEMNGTRALVLSPDGPGALESTLLGLGRFAHFAAHVRRAAQAEPQLLDTLDEPFVDSQPVVALAHALRLPYEALLRLDAKAPSFRIDLGLMARIDFDVPVHVHAHLRPGRWRRQGLSTAEDLLRRVPPGGFQLVLSDSPLFLEHVSPYVRDLGHALYAWGVQNSDRLTTPGLTDALHASSDAPHPDLASLVALDLVPSRPGLLEERRASERTAGLHVTDQPGVVSAWAGLGAMSGAEAFLSNREGTLVMISSPMPEVWVEAAKVLLGSGRVEGVATVLAAPWDVDQPVVPHVLLGGADGFRLRGAEGVGAEAKRLDMAVQEVPCMEISHASEARHALEVARAAQRAQVMGDFGNEQPAFLVLYPRGRSASRPGLATRLCELDAARLALSSLCRQEAPRAPSPPSDVRSSGFRRRFRA